MEFNKPYAVWARTRLEAMILLEAKGKWPKKPPFSMEVTRNLLSEDKDGRLIFTFVFKKEAPTGPPIVRNVYG